MPPSELPLSSELPLAGMTTRTLLELIARASTLTVPALIQAARVSPDILLLFLERLNRKNLIMIEGEDTLQQLKAAVDDLTAASAQDEPEGPDPLICGVLSSVIAARRDLLDHMPQPLHDRKISITRKGFGKAFSL